MTYICWIADEGTARILGFRDKVFTSSGQIKYHTPKQFERIVGWDEAKAAVERYHREQDQLNEEFLLGHAGRA